MPPMVTVYSASSSGFSVMTAPHGGGARGTGRPAPRVVRSRGEGDLHERGGDAHGQGDALLNAGRDDVAGELRGVAVGGLHPDAALAVDGRGSGERADEGGPGCDGRRDNGVHAPDRG